MNGGHILCDGRPVPFRPGESVASALIGFGIRDLGGGHTGLRRAVFCGIGQCQGCLVLYAGRWVESCLLPCADGLVIELGYADRTGGANG